MRIVIDGNVVVAAARTDGVATKKPAYLPTHGLRKQVERLLSVAGI